MIDIAALVLGDFQDTLVSGFGASAGWAIGHIIVLGMAIGAIFAVRGREHILEHSGLGKSTLNTLFVLALLTLAQYAIFTAVFSFPSEVSIGLAIVSSFILRWHVTVLE